MSLAWKWRHSIAGRTLRTKIVRRDGRTLLRVALYESDWSAKIGGESRVRKRPVSVAYADVVMCIRFVGMIHRIIDEYDADKKGYVSKVYRAELLNGRYLYVEPSSNVLTGTQWVIAITNKHDLGEGALATSDEAERFFNAVRLGALAMVDGENGTFRSTERTYQGYMALEAM